MDEISRCKAVTFYLVNYLGPGKQIVLNVGLQRILSLNLNCLK